MGRDWDSLRLMAEDLEKLAKNPQEPEGLLRNLRTLIQEARQKALRAVDAVQVLTCWEIGRYIVEFEQGGSIRAEYGTRLLPIPADSLTNEFGRGFDASNLRYMRLFYQAFPIRDALRHELSWTHYRTLLKVDQAGARSWYMAEAAAQGWSTRALERQINTLYYERLLATSDRTSVEAEAFVALAPFRLRGTLSAIQFCLNSLVFQELGACSKRIWNEPFWTTCSPFFSSSVAASLSWDGSTGSAQRQKTFTSIWSSTTFC